MSGRPRIAVVIGTRPEAIKMVPVIRGLRGEAGGGEGGGRFDTRVIATAQHRLMLDQVLSLFGISADIDLDIMTHSQTLSGLTSAAVTKMQEAVEAVRPDLILVQGDTTTTMAAALAGFYNKVPVGHVEAGLRSHDPQNPYPEETNRRITTLLADIHFAPTPRAKRNLLEEAVEPEKIVVTGNTVVDALHCFQGLPFDLAGSPLAGVDLSGKRVVLLTCHRRETWGRELQEICLAVKELVSLFPDVMVVYPVHLNPNVSGKVNGLLGSVEGVVLTGPLDYRSFIYLMKRAHFILTDSGGVQEEAPSFGKPVLVLRKVTERPEALEAGLSRLVGSSKEELIRQASELLTDRELYGRMSQAGNPFGDGKATGRIVRAIGRWFDSRVPLIEPEREFGQDGKHGAG